MEEMQEEMEVEEEEDEDEETWQAPCSRSRCRSDVWSAWACSAEFCSARCARYACMAYPTAPTSTVSTMSTVSIPASAAAMLLQRGCHCRGLCPSRWRRADRGAPGPRPAS